MGAIQSSINNLLATAAIAAKLSPGIEDAAEARKTARYAKHTAKVATKEVKGYNKVIETHGDTPAAHNLAGALFEKVDPIVDVAEEAHEKAVAAAQKRFETSLSEDATKKLAKAEFDRDVFAENAQNFRDMRRETLSKSTQKTESLVDKYLKAGEAASEKLQQEQQRVRNSEFFRKPTQSIEQDLKEIGGNI